MSDPRLWRHFDWVLLLAVALLIGYGVTMIYSATLNVESLAGYVTRQVLYSVMGLGVLMIVAAVDYRIWNGIHRIAYVAAVLLLVSALFLGTSEVGQVRRWFKLGPFDVQPAEVSKYLVVLVLAEYLSSRQERLDQLPVVLGAIAMLGLPILLVLVQPNLSTALLLLAVGVVMIYVAGVPWQYLAALAGAGVAALPLAWIFFRDYIQTNLPHVIQRLAVYTGLIRDPAERYNIDQALTSIGSGGFWGKGFLNPSSLSQLHFLRVRHTDFIFSVIAEELGMVGVLVLFALLLLLLYRMLRIADRSRDAFGRYVVIGYTMLIFIQAAVNIAMNLSLLPVAGLPLPFVSYGGSALLTLMFALGFCESVAMRQKKLEF